MAVSSRLLSSSLRSSSTRLTLIFTSPNLIFSTPRRMSTAAGPWLMLPPTFKSGRSTVYNFYSLPDNKVVSFNSKRFSEPICVHVPQKRTPRITLNAKQTTEIVGSTHGWLALFDRRNCHLFLWNPITGRHVKLPSVYGLGIPQQNMDCGYRCVRKVIISCDDPESEECRAMLIYRSGRNYSYRPPYEAVTTDVAFCCPTISVEWIPIRRQMPHSVGIDRRDYQDVVFSKNMFFCLTKDELEGWDVEELHTTKLPWSNKDLLGDQNYLSWYDQAQESLFKETGLKSKLIRYLVAAPDHKLFLISRHLVIQHSDNNKYMHSVAFDVHKIDRDEEGGGGKLSYVESRGLDGLAIFVGHNHSFAVSASDHQLKPNSIYFTDAWYSGGYDIGIFDYGSRTISPCYYPCDLQSFKKIEPPPIWFTPTQ